MLTILEARGIVAAYAAQRGAVWFSDDIIERDGCWFFPVGYIGSSGVIVNKHDGQLYVLGSGLPLDDWFWGHERGFLSDLVTLRISRVYDMNRTIEFLLDLVDGGPPRSMNPNPRRVWLTKQLETLPCDLAARNLGLRIPTFRAMRPTELFEYELLAPTGETTPARSG